MGDLGDGLRAESDSLLNEGGDLGLVPGERGGGGGGGGGGVGRARSGVQAALIGRLQGRFSLRLRLFKLFRVVHLQLDPRRWPAKHFRCF